MQSRRYLPLLSYALNEVDVGMDSSRDDGDARLSKLRALLRTSVKTPGLENLLNWRHRSSMAQLLSPRSSKPFGSWEEAELWPWRSRC